MKPDTKRFKPGQIAAYAHRIASHASLRLRRELGSSVRLPGSAFRKRKDGSSYVTPGVLAAALDWSELESWFDTSDNADGPQFMPGSDISTMPDIGEVTETDSEAAQVDTEDETRRQRLEALERNSNRLSRRQYKIMAALIAGETFDDIQNKTGIKKGLTLREVSISAAILGPDVLAPLAVS
jgi:DNA-directed RNA polymerase specialized sigma24 family protein